MKRRLRDLLGAGLVAASLLAAACTPAAQPAPTTAPAAPAARPTEAPKPTTAASPAASPAAAAQPAASPAGSPAAAASPVAAASPAAQAYQPTPLSPRVALKVGLLSALANAPLYIAAEKGYFTDEGLDVELVRLPSGAQLLPSLASGQLDAGVSSPGAALFSAVGREIPLKIVADMGSYTKGHGFGAFVVRQDLADTIKEAKDLKGRTVAVTGRGVATHMMMLRFLEQGGLTEQDVNLQTMGFPDILAAMTNKQVDAAQLTEPFIAQGIADGVLVRWKGNDELFLDQLQAVLTYTPKLIEEKPEAARRLIVAYERGLRDYEAAVGPQKRDAEAVASMIAKHLGIRDPGILLKAVPAGFQPDGRVNAASLKEQQDWYVKQGLVKEPVAIDDIVDNGFIEAALKTLGG